MIPDLLWGAGLVLAIEGLVLALLPGRVEDALAILSRMPPEARRAAGLAALAAGVGLLWLARTAG